MTRYAVHFTMVAILLTALGFSNLQRSIGARAQQPGQWLLVVGDTEAYSSTGDLLWMAEPGEWYLISQEDSGWVLAVRDGDSPDNAVWILLDDRVSLSTDGSASAVAAPAESDATSTPAVAPSLVPTAGSPGEDVPTSSGSSAGPATPTLEPAPVETERPASPVPTIRRPAISAPQPGSSGTTFSESAPSPTVNQPPDPPTATWTAVVLSNTYYICCGLNTPSPTASPPPPTATRTPSPTATRIKGRGSLPAMEGQAFTLP